MRTDVEHRPGVSKPANSSRGGPLPGDLRRAGRRDEWRRPGGLTRNLSHRALAWGLVLEGSRRSPTRAAWRLPQAPQWTGSRGRVHGTHPRPASSSSGPRDPVRYGDFAKLEHRRANRLRQTFRRNVLGRYFLASDFLGSGARQVWVGQWGHQLRGVWQCRRRGELAVTLAPRPGSVFVPATWRAGGNPRPGSVFGPGMNTVRRETPPFSHRNGEVPAMASGAPVRAALRRHNEV